MAQPPQDDSFLGRWSKRKRAATEAQAPQPEPETEAVAVAPEEESLSPEELAALPSLEELTPQTDIRPFMRKGVPQAMRNAALRKMWMLTPAIRDHNNPAVDYAWDWNTPGGVPGDGVAPTPARAAEMLRELMAPRRDAADAKAPETEEKGIATPQEARAVSAPQNPASTPEAVPSPGADASPPRPGKAEANQSGNDAPPPRKRHGGALPG